MRALSDRPGRRGRSADGLRRSHHPSRRCLAEHGKTGTEAVHVGAPFADEKKVEIDSLLADPDPYVGKTVRLEGSVASYCHHQRGWFALADADGTVIRIITAPGFRPGAEIGVDHRLRAINERLGLEGDEALPFRLESSTSAVVK